MICIICYFIQIMENSTREYKENMCLQKFNWIPFLRQLFICSGTWTVYFMMGLSTGFPTVLVPQLRRANQTISDELASWLPAIHVYGGIPWVIILSALIIAIGRKRSHIIVCISSLSGFIIFFFSSNMTHFLIGGVIHGALFSAYLTTSIAILTEYISAKYRGIFLSFKSATFFWGILTSNTMGTFLYWQTIAILGIVCGLYALVNVIVWPESPLWLASTGKFEDCKTAHRWLKGDDEESEKELGKLLKSYENRKFVKEQWSVRDGIKTICRWQFMKPIFLSNLLICLHSFSGKLIFTIYAIDILKKITSSEKAAYSGMLILDCVTLASMYLGCFISKVLKRRVMLLGFNSLGIAFMILISGYLYLVKLLILSENKYVSLVLLSGYSISISCGPMILSTSIISELLPLKSRALSMCIMALTFKFINGTFIKLAPLVFKTLAIPGTFALYAVLSIVFLIITYFYLPETKDKTLHDIQECLRGEDKTKGEESSELINVAPNHGSRSHP